MGARQKGHDHRNDQPEDHDGDEDQPEVGLLAHLQVASATSSIFIGPPHTVNGRESGPYS